MSEEFGDSRDLAKHVAGKLLFDFAFVLGRSDHSNFCENVIEKIIWMKHQRSTEEQTLGISIYLAHSGWGVFDIVASPPPVSENDSLSSEETFYLVFDMIESFEAMSWVEAQMELAVQRESKRKENKQRAKEKAAGGSGGGGGGGGSSSGKGDSSSNLESEDTETTDGEGSGCIAGKLSGGEKEEATPRKGDEGATHKQQQRTTPRKGESSSSGNKKKAQFKEPPSPKQKMKKKGAGRSGVSWSESPVCFMCAGYVAGWFSLWFEKEGLPSDIVAVEINCVAMGDDCCRFLVCHRSMIGHYLAFYLAVCHPSLKHSSSDLTMFSLFAGTGGQDALEVLEVSKLERKLSFSGKN